MLPLSEMVKVIDLIRKEKNHMLKLLRSIVRMNLLSMKLQKRKKKFMLILLSYLKLKELWPHFKCLVKMEKVLSFYNKVFCERERDHIHITFITIYCYNGSILLLFIAFNLLLCLIYKLNFVTGMYI